MKKGTKSLALLIVLMMCIGLFSACSKGESKTDDSKGDAVKISIWSTLAESQDPTSAHQRLVKWVEEYNATNTDNIVVDFVGNKNDDAILTAVSSGSGPDIFMGYWNTTSTWADRGALMDITDYVNNDQNFDKDDFANVGWEQATYDNKIWGVPFIMNTTTLYYRADLLREAGYSEPPATFEELKDMAIALTKYDADGNIVQAGFIPDYPWMDTVCWSVMAGAQWIDENNKINFDSDAMKESYQFQLDIYNELGYDKITKFKEGFGTRDSAENPLLKGKVAMMFYSELMLPSLVAYGSDVEWDVTSLPHGSSPDSVNETMLTTNQWKISSKTKHADEAWKVLSRLTSKESYASFAEGASKAGAFYSRKSAVEAVKAMDVNPAMIKIADTMLAGTGRGFPNSAYVNEYLSAISSQMSLIFSGDLSIDEASKEVVKIVQPLADKHPIN